jgi:hypothetical protein
MIQLCLKLLVGGTIAAVASSAAHAQPSDATSLYSQGVHAYFAGQSAQAEYYLSTARALNPDDPRTYYFLALARMRQGRGDEARFDMQTGAALEAQQPNRFAVGISLERVQGSDRLLLEHYRRQGRASHAALRVERDRARYDQIQKREPEVIHQQATIPLDGLLQPAGSRPAVVFQRPARPTPAWAPASASAPINPAAGKVAADDPFADDAAAPAATATPAAAAPKVAVPPILPPQSTPAAAQPSASVPSAGDADNPFGDAVPRVPAQTPPSDAKSGGTTPPDNDDPFRSK